MDWSLDDYASWSKKPKLNNLHNENKNKSYDQQQVVLKKKGDDLKYKLTSEMTARELEMFWKQQFNISAPNKE